MIRSRTLVLVLALLETVCAAKAPRQRPRTDTFDFEGWQKEHEAELQKEHEGYQDGRCKNPLHNASYFWLDPQIALDRSLAYGVRVLYPRPPPWQRRTPAALPVRLFTVNAPSHISIATDGPAARLACRVYVRQPARLV